MKFDKKPELLLKVSVEILEKGYKVAKKKEDLENMLAIADRLMLLYTMLDESKDSKKSKPLGFSLLEMDDDE